MKKILLFSLALTASASMLAQGAHDFKINEVYVAAPACCGSKAAAQPDSCAEPAAPCCAAQKVSYQDEYGDSPSWIEILNTSYSTHDIRNCFLTNDRRVLDPDITTPERIALMSVVQKGDERTSLSAKERITFFADGHVNRGTLHTRFTLTPGQENWIALYDGNGVTLLDSVTVPAGLQPNQSYARIYNKETDSYEWVVASGEEVTPDASNEVGTQGEDKVAEWKRSDPYGIAMTIIAMGIVFVCLILLSEFFQVFGWLFDRMAKLNRVKAIRAIHEKAEKLVVMAKDGTETRGIEMENYAAAIALALHEYTTGVHDVESGVITIQHHDTEWENKSHLLRHAPSHHEPKPAK